MLRWLSVLVRLERLCPSTWPGGICMMGACIMHVDASALALIVFGWNSSLWTLIACYLENVEIPSKLLIDTGRLMLQGALMAETICAI